MSTAVVPSSERNAIQKDTVTGPSTYTWSIVRVTSNSPTSNSTPAICFYDGHFHAFMKVVGSEYRIFHYMSLISEIWTDAPNSSLGSGITTSAAPSAIVYGGKLHLFWRDAPGGRSMYHGTTTNFRDWTIDQPTNVFPAANSSLATLNQSLYLVCQDYGQNSIMHPVYDGNNWTSGYSGATTNNVPGWSATMASFTAFIKTAPLMRPGCTA